MSLRAQARTREALRRAVRRYAAQRGGTGQHTDTVGVTLRDGTPAVALIRVDLIPDAAHDPTITQEQTP